MKFAIKAEGRDFAVPAIEAFWWPRLRTSSRRVAT